MTRFGRAPVSLLGTLVLAIAALPAAPARAQTVPGEALSTPDAMTRLLQDRGLIPTDVTPAASSPPATADPSTIEQVRDRASELVVAALNFLGMPYRRGGSSADTGFDCSGFTKHLFETTLGFALPRRVDDQAKAAGLIAVSRQELQPGDLVFFNTLRRTFSHVGVYMGDGKFIHAPRSGAEIRVESMHGAYWAQRFTGARRVAGSQPAERTVGAPDSPQDRGGWFAWQSPASRDSVPALTGGRAAEAALWLP